MSVLKTPVTHHMIKMMEMTIALKPFKCLNDAQIIFIFLSKPL